MPNSIAIHGIVPLGKPCNIKTRVAVFGGARAGGQSPALPHRHVRLG